MGVAYDYINDKILKEKFTNIFRPGYIRIKGVTMPERFKDFHEIIENWEVYDDDVWICSFPKTGTTWTQEMAWLIKNDLDFEGAQVGLGERFPFMDYTILFDYRKLMETNNEFQPPIYLTDSVRYVGEQRRPRYIKTHLPWCLLPKQIQEGTKKPKIIYVSRNPKDTCVSYFHHCKLIEGYKGDFEEFCKLFFDGKVCYGPYWTNVLPFWTRKNQSNILFLKYEDLKCDLPGSIEKVGQFFGKKLTREQVAKLVGHLSFENMKNNKAVNYEALLEMNKKFKLSEEDGQFMRTGISGGYRKEMNSEIIEQFNEWTKKNSPGNGLGY